jgi:anti-sigma regulatory factor (Ser/Thr protein kinase)
MNNNQYNIQEQVFPATVEEIPQMIDYVSYLAEAVGMHPRRVLQLQLAVEEAVMNTCSYAYQVPPGEILVRVYSEESRFAVELVDEGIPFDPLAAEEPDTKAAIEDRQIGGLGILLIRRTMDEVHYRREGNKNILVLGVRL